MKDTDKEIFEIAQNMCKQLKVQPDLLIGKNRCKEHRYVELNRRIKVRLYTKYNYSLRQIASALGGTYQSVSQQIQRQTGKTLKQLNAEFKNDK